MPRAKTTSLPKRPRSPNGVGSRTPAEFGEVMTLTDAAAYLRITEPDVLRIVREQGLPGRNIGSQWRFLKAALTHWLRPAPPQSHQEALLPTTRTSKHQP